MRTLERIKPLTHCLMWSFLLGRSLQEGKYGYPGLPEQDPEMLERLKQRIGQPLLYIEPDFIEIVEPNLEITDKRHDPQSLQNSTKEHLDQSVALKKENAAHFFYTGVELWPKANQTFATTTGSFIIPTPRPPKNSFPFKFFSTISFGTSSRIGSKISIGVECNVMSMLPFAHDFIEIIIYYQWSPGPKMMIPNLQVVPGNEIVGIVDVFNPKYAAITIVNMTKGIWTQYSVWYPNPSYIITEDSMAFWGVSRYARTGPYSKLANYGSVTFDFANTTTTDKNTISAVDGKVIDMMDNQATMISKCFVYSPDNIVCVYTGPR